MVVVLVVLLGVRGSNKIRSSSSSSSINIYSSRRRRRQIDLVVGLGLTAQGRFMNPNFVLPNRQMSTSMIIWGSVAMTSSQLGVNEGNGENNCWLTTALPKVEKNWSLLWIKAWCACYALCGLAIGVPCCLLCKSSHLASHCPTPWPQFGSPPVWGERSPEPSDWLTTWFFTRDKSGRRSQRLSHMRESSRKWGMTAWRVFDITCHDGWRVNGQILTNSYTVIVQVLLSKWGIVAKVALLE